MSGRYQHVYPYLTATRIKCRIDKVPTLVIKCHIQKMELGPLTQEMVKWFHSQIYPFLRGRLQLVQFVINQAMFLIVIQILAHTQYPME